MINFSSISQDNIFGKFLRFCLRLIPGGMVLPVMQGRMRSKKWIYGSGNNNGYWLGSYELELQNIFCEVIKKGSTVYDIGANVGFFTILASDLVGNEGKVYAFEPLPQNVACLKKHIELNSCKNVEVIETAVSNNTGTASLKFEGNSAEACLSETGGLKVKTIDLDSFFKMRQISPPDYIKIDAEGAEFSLFLGAKSLIQKYLPAIFLSLHGHNSKDCRSFLEASGYSLKSITPGKSVEETYSIFASVRKNINV